MRRVRLPAGPDNAKVGLDDYLLHHSKDEFEQLPALAAPGKGKPGRTIKYLDLATNEPGPIAWILERILAQQTVSILGGDAGLGKTWLGLTLGQAVASGRPWLGQFPVCQGPVLHYDEESAPVLLHHRISALRRSEPDLPADLSIRYRLDTGLQVDVLESVAMIEADLGDQAAALIVIDSFRACFAGDENKSAEVRVALQYLRHIAHAWSCAILVLHHTRKISQASNASSQMLRGSTDLRGAVLDPHSIERYARLDLVDVEQLRADMADHDARLAELERQRERLRWLFTRETISFEELERDLCALDLQRREVQEQRHALEVRLLQQEDLAARLDTLHNLMEALRSKVDTLDLEEKRLLFRDLGLRVTVQPDRSVQIDALIPVPERADTADPPTVDQTPSPRTLPSDPASRGPRDGTCRPDSR